MNAFRTYSALLLVLILGLLPFYCNGYWIDVATNIGLYMLLSLSLNIILGQAGIFHMGHTTFYAIGAYFVGYLNTEHNIPVVILIPLAGFAAALFGWMVGRVLIGLRGDYFLIATIALVEITRIALVNDVWAVTGGSNGIFGIDRPMLFGFSLHTNVQFYYLVWVSIAIVLMVLTAMFSSRFGRALNYIKEDDIAAEGCGINVLEYKRMAFVFGSFIAGIAGGIFATKMTIISPNSFSFWESIIIFVVVVLSGGSQLGVVFSTILVVGLPEVFRDLMDARMLLFGLVMMFMMVIRPQGLLPPLARKYQDY